jgi:SAM-dependent methyltransferase
MPGQVRVLAYFPNVVLISAFLGLGIGCLLVHRRVPAWAWPASLLLLAGVAAAASRVAFTQQSTSEHLWLLYYDLPRGAPVIDGIRLPIVALFVVSAVTFVPLGHFIAARLREFQAESKPLKGYALDLLGSLLGVIVFAIISFRGAFPIVWFSIIFGVGLLIVGARPLTVLLYLILAASTLVVVSISERAQWYSPYYALTARPNDSYVEVLTNGSLHQVALPLRRDLRLPPGDLTIVRAGYHLSYGFLKKRARRVLVLGAGTGNDVAVALDQGAERVDAVEIDPRILDIGRRMHPDSPYADPRVRTFTTDARAFLNDTNETYDLIVFGTLDSMTRLSALSNVRLDNFVYTVECFRAARWHLSPDGGVVMYFLVAAPFIETHHDRAR